MDIDMETETETLIDMTETDLPDSSNWRKLVDIIQAAFWEGLMAE